MFAHLLLQLFARAAPALAHGLNALREGYAFRVNDLVEVEEPQCAVGALPWRVVPLRGQWSCKTHSLFKQS